MVCFFVVCVFVCLCGVVILNVFVCFVCQLLCDAAHFVFLLTCSVLVFVCVCVCFFMCLCAFVIYCVVSHFLVLFVLVCFCVFLCVLNVFCVLRL